VRTASSSVYLVPNILPGIRLPWIAVRNLGSYIRFKAAQQLGKSFKICILFNLRKWVTISATSSGRCCKPFRFSASGSVFISNEGLEVTESGGPQLVDVVSCGYLDLFHDFRLSFTSAGDVHEALKDREQFGLTSICPSDSSGRRMAASIVNLVYDLRGAFGD